MSDRNRSNQPKEILAQRYEIQKKLASKGGRKTLLARDLQTEKLVVVKLLSFGDDFTWDDLKLFEREAETLKSLNHPAIPKYLDYFEIDLSNTKGFALVQSYIDAPSLEEQVQAGRRFSQEEIEQIAKAILKILDYLHSYHPPVIHRDLKSSNILLTNRSGHNVGDIYLVDLLDLFQAWFLPPYLRSPGMHLWSFLL
jgi:serine/threonine protein kinase